MTEPRAPEFGEAGARREPAPETARWAVAAGAFAIVWGFVVLLWPARGLTFLWDDWILLERLAHQPWPQSWLQPVNEHWKPIYVAWFQLEHALFGMNHTLYLAATLALHGLNVGLLARLLGVRCGQARAGAIAALAFGVSTSYREVLWWACLGGLALGLTIVLVGLLAFERVLERADHGRENDARSRERRALFVAGLCSFAAPLAFGTGLALGPALTLEAWFRAPRERRVRLALAALLPWLAYGGLYAVFALGTTGAQLAHEATRGPVAAVFFAVDSVGLGVVGRTLGLEAARGNERPLGVALALAYVVGILVLAWRLDARARLQLGLAQVWLFLVIAPVALVRNEVDAAAAWSRYQYFPGLAWTMALALGLARLSRTRPRAALGAGFSVAIVVATLGFFAAREEHRPWAPRQRAEHPELVRRLVNAAREAQGPVWDPDLASLSLQLQTFVMPTAGATPPTRASTIVEAAAPELHPTWTRDATPESLAPYDRDPFLNAVVSSHARR